MKNIAEIIKLDDNLDEEALIYPVEASLFVEKADVRESVNEIKELIYNF